MRDDRRLLAEHRDRQSVERLMKILEALPSYRSLHRRASRHGFRSSTPSLAYCPV
jgi:hypothetical protein